MSVTNEETLFHELRQPFFDDPEWRQLEVSDAEFAERCFTRHFDRKYDAMQTLLQQYEGRIGHAEVIVEEIRTILCGDE